jgi:hypothetical protein
MPICGSIEECFDTFREYVAQLISKTISKAAHVAYEDDDAQRSREPVLLRNLGFRRGNELTTIPIETDFGTMHFLLGQSLECVPEKRGCRLRTQRYWYRIQEVAGRDTKAILRWEFDPSTPQKYSPLHTHARVKITLSSGALLDLDRVHIPTRWVLMEDVIRFLITDLGVRPPCGDEWLKVLKDGFRRFRNEFCLPPQR